MGSRAFVYSDQACQPALRRIPVPHRLICASLSLVLLWTFAVPRMVRAQPPAGRRPRLRPASSTRSWPRSSPGATSTGRRSSSTSSTTLENFEVLGPGRAPLLRGKREFSWYVRDGMHVRSPVRFDGVTVGDDDRRKYEDDWIKEERDRLERRAKRDAAKAGSAADAASPEPPVGGDTPIATPRFVSEAYFMDFKFEAGNYYLVGHESLDGHDVLRIEYYPTRMFDDNDREHGEEPERAAAAQEGRRRTRRSRTKSTAR